MNHSESDKKKGNERLYPVVFLILFPLAGGSASMEFGLFGGDIATGAFWGAIFGCVLFAFWRLRKR